MIYDRKNSYDKESKKECQNRKQVVGLKNTTMTYLI